MRTRSKPSPTRIDAGWPHQVALPNDLCSDPNFKVIMQWFYDRRVEQVTRQVQAVWPDHSYQEYRLYCFRDATDAEAFRNHFGGVPFDPKKERERGKALGAWCRTDRYERLTRSGPLRLHPIFLPAKEDDGA